MNTEKPPRKPRIKKVRHKKQIVLDEQTFAIWNSYPGDKSALVRLLILNAGGWTQERERPRSESGRSGYRRPLVLDDETLAAWNAHTGDHSAWVRGMLVWWNGNGRVLTRLPQARQTRIGT